MGNIGGMHLCRRNCNTTTNYFQGREFIKDMDTG